jgi:hypothetical protein
MNESRTHFAETLRYMLEGVKNSAGIEENTGTRFGGFGDLIAAANTSRIVSSDGCTTNYKDAQLVPQTLCRYGEDSDAYLRSHTVRLQLPKLSK